MTPGRLGSGDGSNNGGKGRYTLGEHTVGARGVHIRRALEAAGYLTTLDALDVSPKGYPGAHYAVWPPELVKQLLQEMCPRRVCTVCGKPSSRLTETSYGHDTSHANGRFDGEKLADRREATAHVGPQGMTHGRANKNVTTVGWSDCGCSAYFGTCKNCGKPISWSLDSQRWLHESPRVRYCPDNFTPENNPTTEAEPVETTGTWRPARILDPFAGSGTTLAVATGMGYDSIGIDLDERNAHLAQERCGMFLEVDWGPNGEPPPTPQLTVQEARDLELYGYADEGL